MGVVIVEGEGALLGVNLSHPIVTNGDFATRLFPNYFGQYLFIDATVIYSCFLLLESVKYLDLHRAFMLLQY